MNASSATGTVSGRAVRVVLAGLLTCALVAPAALDAQARRSGGRTASERRIEVEGRGGVAIPAGRINDLTDAGPSFGLKVAYPIYHRFAVNLRGDVDLLDGQTDATLQAPDMRLWRYGAGVDFDVLDPDVGRWRVTTSLGLGATSFDSDRFRVPQATTDSDFNQTYFTSTAGLRVGYVTESRLSAFVGADASWAATRGADTEVLRSLNPARLKPFSSAWSVPLTLGVRVRT